MGCWAESVPPGCNRIKVSANLGATAVVPVTPLITSLLSMSQKKGELHRSQKMA